MEGGREMEGWRDGGMEGWRGWWDKNKGEWAARPSLSPLPTFVSL